MERDTRVLALDISGSRTLIGEVSASGELAAVDEVPNTTGDAASYWPAVREAARARADGLAGVGVAFGGPVGRDGRVVSIHVPGWAGVDIAGELAQALGVPVRLGNDADCGALGEARFGGWGAPHTLVFLTCSTGIGGGIVSDGRLLRGSRGLAGELGHVCIDPDGRPCSCGSRGCLEAMCSGTAIAARAAAAVIAAHGESSLQAAMAGGRLPGARPVFEAAAAGDAVARKVLVDVFADFGRGIAAIHNVFDPNLIVIGGGVGRAGSALTDPVTAAARPWIMNGRRDDLRLETAALGLYSQLYGAAALAFDAVSGEAPESTENPR